MIPSFNDRFSEHIVARYSSLCIAQFYQQLEQPVRFLLLMSLEPDWPQNEGSLVWNDRHSWIKMHQKVLV